MQWRNEHPLLTGHTRRVLFVVIGENRKTVENYVIDYGLTIDMKNIRQQATQCKILFAD